jgi:hypothetical protein
MWMRQCTHRYVDTHTHKHEHTHMYTLRHSWKRMMTPHISITRHKNVMILYRLLMYGIKC